MSATLAMKNIKVRAFGTTTTVPDNAIAKLMYYLHCVSVVIDYHDRTLTDYQNYDELTSEELLAIYVLAKLFDPSIFIEKSVFIVDEKLLIDSNNQFYEVTDETVGFHASREIVIGGKTVKVLKLMACNNTWLSKNYYMPMKLIDDLINQIKTEEENKKNYNYQSQVLTTQTTIIEKPPIVIEVEFKNSPVSTACPFCKRFITTKTQSKLNCAACCCCLMFGLFYFCFQVCNGKNGCCCDVDHICPMCGKIVGHYSAC